MRIAVVATSFPTRDDDGVGHFVLAHAEERARHHEVHVIAPGQRFRWREESWGPVAVHWAGGGTLFGWPGAAERARRAPWRLAGGAAFAAGLRAHLRRLAPVDRLVAHWAVPTGWPLLAGRREPLDVIAHGADVRLLLALPRRLRAAIVRSLVDRGGEVRFVAHQGRKQLLAHLEPPLAERTRRHSRVEPLPLRLPSRASLQEAEAVARPWLAGAEQRPVVASVGRLIPSKRFDLAIRAVAQCHPVPILLVVGDGPARASLEDLASRLGVEARFTGLVPRTVALALMGCAQALLHPSRQEAAPTVVREARALNVAVVGCDAGDLSRWAARDPGIVLSAPDAPALAAALQDALTRSPASGGDAAP